GTRHDGTEELVELLRDGPRQAADRLHLLRLQQGPLTRALPRDVLGAHRTPSKVEAYSLRFGGASSVGRSGRPDYRASGGGAGSGRGARRSRGLLRSSQGVQREAERRPGRPDAVSRGGDGLSRAVRGAAVDQVRRDTVALQRDRE